MIALGTTTMIVLAMTRRPYVARRSQVKQKRQLRMTTMIVSKAIAALFGNDKPTKDKGREKSDNNDSTDNKAIAALFGKDEPSQAKGKTKKADENDSSTRYEGTRSGKDETMSKVNDLPLLNKDEETPSKGGSRMITIPWCQPVDESSNMEEEKQTELTHHKSKTLF
jgi:hypothetical protein